MNALKIVTAFAAAVFIVQGSAVAVASPDARHCFFSNQFSKWKAADAKTLYIRVGPNRYFRLDLAGECRTVLMPDAYLITEFRGSNSVCTALDWDLRVAQPPAGIPEPCIVAKMTELTADEVGALPKGAKP